MGISLFRRIIEKSIFHSGSGGRMMSNSSFDGWRPLLMVADDSGKWKLHNVANGREDETNYTVKQRSGLSVVGMSHGWLALYNQISHGMHILNPINGHRIELPSLPHHPHSGVTRVVLSHCPDQYSDIGRAAVIYGGGKKLAFCAPGRSKEWTPAVHAEAEAEAGDDDIGWKYEDVIYSGLGKSGPLQFDCVTTNPMESELERWNVTDPRSPVLHKRSGGLDNFAPPCRSKQDWELKRKCWRVKYFVVGDQFCHGYYLVVRHVIPPRSREHLYKTIDFDVYGIGVGSGFGYMKASLEDSAIFIGTNHSAAVYAGNGDQVKPNCIYFTDDNRLMHNTGAGSGHDNGIFDYQKSTFSTCGCGNSNCPLDTPNLDQMMNINPAPAPLWFHFSSVVSAKL